MRYDNTGRRVLGMGLLLSMAVSGLSSLVRKMDRRKEAGQARERPSLMEGAEKKGVRSADGTTLHVDYLGERDPTVFLVHGFTVDAREFHYQRPYLAGMYRVVGLDFRGHGRSGRPESGDYRLERFAEDIKAVVDAFDTESFVVAGHSLGGLATFKFYELFGKEYEGRLKGLAIIDSTGCDIGTGLKSDFTLKWKVLFCCCRVLEDNAFFEAVAKKLSGNSIYYAFLRWIVAGEKPPASQLELLQQAACETPVATLKGIAGLGDVPIEHVLPGVNVPVMLLTGSRDNLLKNDLENRRTLSLLPDARLEVLEGAGHIAPQERPEEFNRALGGFLEEVLT